MLHISHIVVIYIRIQDLVTKDYDSLVLSSPEGHLKLDFIMVSERFVQHAVTEIVLELETGSHKATDEVLVVMFDCISLAIEPAHDFNLVGKIVHDEYGIEVHLNVFSSAAYEWLPSHVAHCGQVALSRHVAKGLVACEELVDVLLLFDVAAERYSYLTEAGNQLLVYQLFLELLFFVKNEVEMQIHFACVIHQLHIHLVLSEVFGIEATLLDNSPAGYLSQIF